MESWNSLLVSFKPLAVSLSNINIDCQMNNLEISDSNNNVFDYCKSDMPLSYTYVSQKSYWIRIRKSKHCFFCSAPISFTFELLNEIPTTLDTSIEIK